MSRFSRNGSFAIRFALFVCLILAGASDSVRADDAGHWAAIVRPAPAYDRSVVVYRTATRQLIALRLELATLAFPERSGAGVFWLRASDGRASRSLRFVRVR